MARPADVRGSGGEMGRGGGEEHRVEVRGGEGVSSTSAAEDGTVWAQTCGPPNIGRGRIASLTRRWPSKWSLSQSLTCWTLLCNLISNIGALLGKRTVTADYHLTVNQHKVVPNSPLKCISIWPHGPDSSMSLECFSLAQLHQLPCLPRP